MGNRTSVTEGTEVTENWTWCVSEIAVEEFGFDWTFRNYPAFTARKQIFSPIFKSPQSQHEWRLSIVPHRKDTNDIDYLGIYLQLNKLGPKKGHHDDDDQQVVVKVPFRAQFTVMTQDGGVTKRVLSQGTEITECVGNIKGFPKFYKTSEFNRDLRPMDGPVTFRCRIWVYGNEQTVTVSTSSNGFDRPSEGKTRNDGGGENEKETKNYYHDDTMMIRDDKSNFNSLPSLEIFPRGQ